MLVVQKSAKVLCNLCWVRLPLVFRGGAGLLVALSLGVYFCDLLFARKKSNVAKPCTQVIIG